jgi:hypothetical protein
MTDPDSHSAADSSQPAHPAGGGDAPRPSRITLRSPLDCPGCGHRFKGTWTADRRTSDQECPQCGYVFSATWKGWSCVPEQVIITRQETR